MLPVHEEGELGEVGARAGVAENGELGDVNEAGGGQVQLNQEEVNLETMPVVTEENVNLETIPDNDFYAVPQFSQIVVLLKI